MAEILRDEGYRVDLAFDGREGQKIMEQDIYDLLLLDLKLPGINGLGILKRAKEIKIKAKIIVITGNLMVSPANQEMFNLEDKENKDSAVLKTAEALFSKPFAIEKLLDKIKELLH